MGVGHQQDAVGGLAALDIDLDLNRDRRGADPDDGGVKTQDVSHIDRMLEDQLLDGYRDDPPPRAYRRDRGARQIDLRHQIAAEHIPGWVGVGGHGEDTQRRLFLGQRE